MSAVKVVKSAVTFQVVIIVVPTFNVMVEASVALYILADTEMLAPFDKSRPVSVIVAAVALAPIRIAELLNSVNVL